MYFKKAINNLFSEKISLIIFTHICEKCNLNENSKIIIDNKEFLHFGTLNTNIIYTIIM